MPVNDERWAVMKARNMAVVYPINDIKKHKLFSTDCPCKPGVEGWEGSIILVHQAFDNRDWLEKALHRGRMLHDDVNIKNKS